MMMTLREFFDAIRGISQEPSRNGHEPDDLGLEEARSLREEALQRQSRVDKIVSESLRQREANHFGPSIADALAAAPRRKRH